MGSSRAVTTIVLCLILWLSSSRGGAMALKYPDTTYQYGWCNNEEYVPVDRYAPYVTAMLRDLEEMAESFPQINGTLIDGKGEPCPCYGSRSCTYTDDWFTVPGCKSCFGEAVRQLRARCPHRVGAQIVLADCSVRYEKYLFF